MRERRTTFTHGRNADCPEVRAGNWQRCMGHKDENSSVEFVATIWNPDKDKEDEVKCRTAHDAAHLELMDRIASALERANDLTARTHS